MLFGQKRTFCKDSPAADMLKGEAAEDLQRLPGPAGSGAADKIRCTVTASADVSSGMRTRDASGRWRAVRQTEDTKDFSFTSFL